MGPGGKLQTACCKSLLTCTGAQQTSPGLTAAVVPNPKRSTFHHCRQTSGRKIVEGAHMEIAEPTIADAVSKCASAGASTIIVAPYFLSRGRHIQEDIPALVAAAQQQHPGVKCVVAEPIGLDPLMAELIEMRVINASAAQSVAQAGEA